MDAAGGWCGKLLEDAQPDPATATLGRRRLSLSDSPSSLFPSAPNCPPLSVCPCWQLQGRGRPSSASSSWLCSFLPRMNSRMGPGDHSPAAHAPSRSAPLMSAWLSCLTPEFSFGAGSVAIREGAVYRGSSPWAGRMLRMVRKKPQPILGWDTEARPGSQEPDGSASPGVPAPLPPSCEM